MGICVTELRDYVIRPTLKQLGQYSKAAENLLLGTAAQESSVGFHLRQHNSHNLGIYQISPQRHIRVWDHYLVTLPELASDIRGLASQHEFLERPHAELTTNLSYATAVAWAIYRQHAVVMPCNANNIQALAQQWLLHFSHRAPSSQSMGERRAQFIANYQQFIQAKPLAVA